jgi:hypothetical protein
MWGTKMNFEILKLKTHKLFSPYLHFYVQANLSHFSHGVILSSEFLKPFNEPSSTYLCVCKCACVHMCVRMCMCACVYVRCAWVYVRARCVVFFCSLSYGAFILNIYTKRKSKYKV